MVICDESKCTGCCVCADVCPKNCIKIQYDENGFLHSFVDSSQCINCGKCKSVCPVLNQGDLHSISKSYKAKRNVNEECLKSSSGGVAAIFTEKIISNNGTVIGCGFDDSLQLKHFPAKSLDVAEKFKLSKYIQSNTSGIYKQIKSLLNSGEKVMFIGTPCQVCALNNYLGESKDNLVTVDFICHGVESQKVFNKYLEHYKKNGEITNVLFRNKDNGYVSASKNDLKFVSSNKVLHQPCSKGVVLWFASSLSLRESCYECQFSKDTRCSDITLSDFPGNDVTDDERKYGTSAVYINTEKGKQLFDSVNDELTIKEMDTAELLSRFIRINSSTAQPKCRQAFFKDLDEKTIEELENKYTLEKILPSKLIRHFNSLLNKLSIKR